MVAERSTARKKVPPATPPDRPNPAGSSPRLDSGLAQLDRLIHERIRLGMVSALAVRESLSFNELKKLLKTSDGNLSVHARKLEAGGYVECTKFFENRIPRTEYRLTAAGRAALQRYLDHMERLIQAMKAGNARKSAKERWGDY